MKKVTKNGKTYQQTTLGRIPDNNIFRLNLRSTNIEYSMQTKKKGIATFTSLNTGYTLTRPMKTVAYIYCS